MTRRGPDGERRLYPACQRCWAHYMAGGSVTAYAPRHELCLGADPDAADDEGPPSRAQPELAPLDRLFPGEGRPRKAST